MPNGINPYVNLTCFAVRKSVGGANGHRIIPPSLKDLVKLKSGSGEYACSQMDPFYASRMQFRLNIGSEDKFLNFGKHRFIGIAPSDGAKTNSQRKI